jgi:hypothetical protein
LNGLFLPTSFLSVTKFNSDLFYKNGIWGKIILSSSVIIVPVLFIWSLKQEMSCDLLTLLKIPSAWEMLVSGVIMGYNLPNLIREAIPNTFKLYRKGFSETIKIFKENQELVQKFIEDERKERANTITNKVLDSSEYKNASPGDKTKLDAKLQKWKEDLIKTGTVSDENINNMKLEGKGSENIMRKSLTQIKTFPKLNGEGVYAIARLKDGRTLITHSSSSELYAMYDTDGNRVPIIVKINGVPTVIRPETHKLSTFMSPEAEILAAKIKARDIRKLKPEDCAEFRLVNILAGKLDIKADQIVSLNAFRALNVEPIRRCKHCRLTTQQIPVLSVETDWFKWYYDSNSLYLLPNRGLYNRGRGDDHEKDD